MALVGVAQRSSPWRGGGRVAIALAMIMIVIAGLLMILLEARVEAFVLALAGASLAIAGFLGGIAIGLWRARRVARAAADQSSALQSLLDAMPVTVSIKDKGLRFRYLNESQARFLGIPAAEAHGRTLSEILGPGRVGPRLDRDILRSGEPVLNFNETVRSADGSSREWLVTKVPLRDRAGAITGIGTISIDVTEHNAMARAHSAAEQRAIRLQAELAAAIESLGDGFLLLDQDKRIVAANSTMARMFPGTVDRLLPGVPYEEVVRRNVALGLLPEAIGREEAWVAARLAEFRDEPVSREVALSDGRWVLIHNTPTSAGGYVALRVDITEQKRIEADLHDAKENAERANDAKSAFLANMSHELRTPLNAIIGFAEMIEHGMLGPVGNPRYNGYAADIRQAGRHLLSIINDVLDLSKIEAGRVTLRDQNCDLSRLMTEAVQLALTGEARGGATVTIEAEPDLPIVRGDERSFFQILINLLSNALKFTAADGRVGLRAGRAADGGISIRVMDNGIGIAPADFEKVLAPFGQVEGPLHRRHSGTGLGLPLARSLVELHDGHLTLESEPGRGTTVTVWLPPSRIVPGRSSTRAA
ncbi:MAG: PAS domain-containing protein [Alphaproteobacteria bacterium]|nr:PAS domain-containing protein [Alphaproteobacteria bacterium]